MRERRGAEFGPVSEVQQTLEQWHKEFPYAYQIIGRNPRNILVGEDHYIDGIPEAQGQLIAMARPEYILYEPLRGWQYNPKTKVLELIPHRKVVSPYDYIFDQEKGPQPSLHEIPIWLREVADKNASWVIGCDLTMAEFQDLGSQIAEQKPDKYRFEDRLIRKKAPNETINTFSPEISPHRSKFMGEMIQQYQTKTTRPIISILGYKHVSRIKQSGVLEAAGIDYATIEETKNLSELKK